MSFAFINKFPNEIQKALNKRALGIEHSINIFRLIFLLSVSFFDIASMLLIKSIRIVNSSYNIIMALVSIIGFSIIGLIFYFTSKKKYKPFMSYLSVTFDLSLTFVVGLVFILLPDFPIPISKTTSVILLTIFFIFFNTMSVLRTDRLVVIYSLVLSFILNTILYLLLFQIEDRLFIILVYTDFFILMLGIFNLWVSKQIINSFIANFKLTNANIEINKKNDEINVQKHEILNKNEELNQLVEEITTQRDHIEEQKNQIEIIYKEVEQSIDYATRLQSSILPNERMLSKYLSGHFVMFIPKDKVSGDFYWWTHILNHTVITAADCTGHGVPGAFMSMLGVSFLREIVQKEYVTKPDIILRRLRKEIVRTLKQKTGTDNSKIGMGMKDGMDMALISINHETNILQYAGANNPLYIIRNKNNNEQFFDGLNIDENDIRLMENENFKLFEFRPDKMPIAIYERMDKFSLHEIPLKKGDLLYLFSDGFADQFGGSKGKKFKYKPFKHLLLENADKPMKEQKDILYKTFKSWKSNFEQIDDVEVLGIKI